MWQFFKRYQLFFYFAIVILASHWSLLKPGFNFGHDLNHPARIFEMATGLRDGQFPVVWSQNFLYGYGMPLFEFYAPLPYVVGAFFYLLGLNLVTSAELMILVAGVLTYLGAYYLGKRLFGNWQAGVLVAALLTLAPYRAVDVMVRLALSEAYAIAFLPWILLGIVLVVERTRYAGALLAGSLAALLLAHNLSAIIIAPFLVVFAFFIMILHWQSVSIFWQQLLRLSSSVVLGLGLAAFYVAPALLEKQFTQLDQFTLSSYFDFRQHFLYIRQFFEPWGVWEYGGSMWGPDDEMSYFLGWPYLLVLLTALVQLGSICWQALRGRRRIDRIWWWHGFLLAGSAMALFLTLLKAQPLWELVSFARYIQFPWRLLTLVIMFLALLVGVVWQTLPKRWQGWFFVGVLAAAVIFNTRYFQSEKYESYDQWQFHYQDRIRSWHSNNLYDYVPTGITFFERQGFYLYKKAESAFAHLPAPVTQLLADEFLSQVVPGSLVEKSAYKQFTIELKQPTQVYVHLAVYPGWQASVNGQPVVIGTNEFGLLVIDLAAGRNEVEIMLADTPVRKISKLFSVFSLLLLLWWISKESSRRQSKVI